MGEGSRLSRKTKMFTSPDKNNWDISEIKSQIKCLQYASRSLLIDYFEGYLVIKY